jgi:Gpi18-like mannosyltransferase
MKKILSGWKKEWTGFVIAVILLRLIYAGIGWWVVSSGGPIALNETIYGEIKPYLSTDQFSHYFVNPWFGWDTISYLGIAILGYRHDASIAFMPLYPLLIRFTAPIFGGNYLLAALVLSTLFCILALILMYELFTALYLQKIAREAVVMFLTFPTAFFLLAGYTESLFIVLVLLFWLLARQKRWLWAALVAGLATLTRVQGIVLSAVLLWIMLTSLIENPADRLVGQLRQIVSLFAPSRERLVKSVHPATWLCLLIPPLFAVAYQLWLKVSGYGTIADALRTYWRLETVPPWTGFILFLQRLPTARFHYMDWIDLILFFVVLVASLIALRLLDPAFSLYIWFTLAVLLTRGTPPHLLASYSRYFLALFPLFLLPARLPHQYQRWTVIILFFSLHILLVSIFLWGSWVA